MMDFTGVKDFAALILNTNKYVTSLLDYVIEVGELL